MAQRSHDPDTPLWKRLFIEPSAANTTATDQRPAFLGCAALSLAAGIIGWAMATVYPTWIVPACSLTSILGGILGTRSRLRSFALIGFVMGMFLLPRAVNIVLVLLKA